jgi:hypothetical protein
VRAIENFLNGSIISGKGGSKETDWRRRALSSQIVTEEE